MAIEGQASSLLLPYLYCQRWYILHSKTAAAAAAAAEIIIIIIIIIEAKIEEFMYRDTMNVEPEM